MERTPSPAPPTRSLEIHLPQEIVTIDLGGSLDPNPEAVLDVLIEGNCKVWVWTKLAGEYWRRGLLDAAERLGTSGVECQFTELPTCFVFFNWLNSFNSFQIIASQLVFAATIHAPCQYTHGTGTSSTQNQARGSSWVLSSPVSLSSSTETFLKWHPISGRDVLNERLKDAYYQEAAGFLNEAATIASEVGGDESTIVAFLSRGTRAIKANSLALYNEKEKKCEKSTQLTALF